MKTPKPGQFCTVYGALYRAKKRYNGCSGCIFDNFTSCPNIQDSRKNDSPVLECEINGIIIVKV